MSKPAPWELDPTYLEQTGMDPQQLWRRTHANARQATSQTQSTSSPQPPPSSSSSPATAAPSLPPPNASTSADGSRRPSDDSALLDVSARAMARRASYEASSQQAGGNRQQAGNAGGASTSADGSRRPSDDSALLDVSARAMARRASYEASSQQAGGNRQQAGNAGGASTSADGSRRPSDDSTSSQQADGSRKSPAPATFPSLDPSKLLNVAVNALAGLADAGRAFYDAFRQRVGGASTSADGSRRPSDDSALLDVSARAMARRASYEASSQQADGNRQRVDSVGVLPVDYLLDQRNPVNIVNRLTAAYEDLRRRLEQIVSQHSDVLTYDKSANRVGISPQLQNMLDRYTEALSKLKSQLPSLEGMLMVELGSGVFVWDADAGPPDLALPPDQLKWVADQMKSAKIFVTRQGGKTSIELAPDLKATVEDVNKLFRDVRSAQEDYWSSVQKVVEEFNQSTGGRFKLKIEGGKVVIDETVHRQGVEKIKELNRRYDEEFQKLIQKYGAKVAEDGTILVDPSKLNALRAELNALNAWYVNEFNRILKEHGLKVEGNWIVVDMSIYSDALNKIDELSRAYNERLKNIYSQYSHLLVKTTDEEGRTAYALKPNVLSNVDLYNRFTDVVNAYRAAQQQALQNVLGKYGDVLFYDEATGKITPSKELMLMLERFEQAAQEVSRLIAAMSAVAGMIPTFARRLPVLTVRFQTYDPAQNKFVEVGGETPIYIEDEKMREEVLNWLKQNEGRVRVAAFLGPGKPVVYVYNDRDEGYIIFPDTGKVRRARGVSGMVQDTANAVRYYSLTDEEKKMLERYYRLQWEKEKTKHLLQNLPPAVREFYGAWIAAGQFAPISSSADILIRAVLGHEDPLAGAKLLHAKAEAVKEVSPGAYYAGTATGLAGTVGLGAEAILARGAAKLAAQGVGVQQTVKTPTLVQVATAGLKDAAVPMAVSGAVFGGLEGVKSYLETGKVDVADVLGGAAFGSLMGAFPITRMQALAALGVGAGAAAGSHLIRGYDLATSLAVGEAAGTQVLIGGGLKRLSDAGVKTTRAPEVGVTGFTAVVKPEYQPAPRVDLSGVVLAKRLDSAVANVVADVISGRITVEEANLRLGAIRDAVPDKALFDKILQIHKTLSEPPRAPTLDFATAAKKAAEIVRGVESGKLPGYKAFVELADLRASVADKARFDRLFGANLREYGEQYVHWLLNSGLDKPSIVLNLAKYEDVLGRQFIERYVPDYGRVLAEIEAKLSQLRPVSPREAPAVRLTPEEVFARVRSLFDAVVEGKMDWFKASEELYKMWRDAPPDVRVAIEAALNQLNRVYGEKYGVTLEPWRPPLLEKALRTAELFAADVRSAVANALRAAGGLLSPGHIAQKWRHTRLGALDRKLYKIAESFMSGRISLEEAKKALAELADKYEKFGMEELARAIREKLKDDEMLKRFLDATYGLHRGSRLKSTVWVQKSRLRGTVDAVVDAARDFVPEYRRYTWREWRFAEAEDRFTDLVSRFKRGEVSLETARREISKLVKEIEKTHGREVAEGYRKYFEGTVLKMEFIDVVRKFKRGEMSLEEARAKLMEIVDKIEKALGKEKADLYRRYAEEVLTGKVLTGKRAEEKPRLPDEKDVEWIKRAEEERRRMEQKERERGAEGRGRQQLLLLERPVGEKARVKPMRRRRVTATPLERPAVRHVLTPETRIGLMQALKARAREAEAVADLTAPTPRKPAPLYADTAREVEPPERQRRIALLVPRIRTETPHLVPLPKQQDILETPPDTWRYKVPTVQTFTTPTTEDVPPPPTYTPVTVPRISEVPTVDVPTVPTYKTTPPPRRPPPGWWLFLPPSVFFGDRAGDGAYRVQEGKRQLLALA